MRNVFEQYDENDHLAHYGILGQKWGVRRYQNRDGSLTKLGKQRALKNGEDYTIKSGTKLYRVTSNPNVYNDTSNRLYVSGNKKDHKKWMRLYDQDSSWWTTLYDCRLTAVKDLKVAGETAIGKAWLEATKSEDFRKMALKDVNMAAEKYGLYTSAKNAGELTYDKFSRTLGYHTKSGDAFMKYMKDTNGYDAMIDVYGKHTTDSDTLKGIKEPLIILSPDGKVERDSSKQMRRKYH